MAGQLRVGLVLSRSAGRGGSGRPPVFHNLGRARLGSSRQVKVGGARPGMAVLSGGGAPAPPPFFVLRGRRCFGVRSPRGPPFIPISLGIFVIQAWTRLGSRAWNHIGLSNVRAWTAQPFEEPASRASAGARQGLDVPHGADQGRLRLSVHYLASSPVQSPHPKARLGQLMFLTAGTRPIVSPVRRCERGQP